MRTTIIVIGVLVHVMPTSLEASESRVKARPPRRGPRTTCTMEIRA
jgi:hypothetical protein